MDQKLRSSREASKKETQAFTLTELLISVAILGTLTTISLPSYLDQVNKSRQKEVASTVTRIQTAIASYSDEFGVLPESWAELNRISAVMTDDGPADNNNFDKIKLADQFYEVGVTNTGNIFKITATRSDEPNLNIVACVSLTNGASSIKQGTQAAAASAPNCG